MEQLICTNCGALLNAQTGFHSGFTKWVCRQCGQPLFADENDQTVVTWFCDGCNAVLNEQSGFSDGEGKWVCTECGYENDLSEENIFEFVSDYYSQLKPEWKPFENGKTIGTKGTENGTILEDEECKGYGRITLETCRAYDAITCGVYGSMVHTAFSDKEHSLQKYQSMKAELMKFFEDDIEDENRRIDFYEYFTTKY